jgi:hypothetical protein
MGKGSRPRPFSVSQSDYDASYERIFGKKENKMQARVQENKEQFGSCGCGRSPTGKCCGWHALPKDIYEQKLKEFQEKQNKQPL